MDPSRDYYSLQDPSTRQSIDSSLAPCSNAITVQSLDIQVVHKLVSFQLGSPSNITSTNKMGTTFRIPQTGTWHLAFNANVSLACEPKKWVWIAVKFNGPKGLNCELAKQEYSHWIPSHRSVQIITSTTLPIECGSLVSVEVKAYTKVDDVVTPVVVSVHPGARLEIFATSG